MIDDEKDEQITLDDVLNQTLDAVEKPVEQPETVLEPSDAEETAAEAKARERDEKGRFKAKAENEIAEPVAEEAPAEPVASTEDTENAEPEPKPKLEVSEGHFRGWSPEQRAKFDSLPVEAQEVVLALKRDTDAHYTRKLEEAAHSRKQLEPIAQTLQGLSDIAAASGMDPAGLVQGYAQIERVLSYGKFQDKVNLIGQICQKYGIPFAPQQQLEALDPNEVQNFASLHDRDAELARIRAEYTQIQRELQGYQAQTFQQQIESFQSATNTDGTPRHPHFEVVKATMGSLLQSGRARSLDEAYAMAAEPINKAIEAQTAAARAAAEKSRLDAVERAKRAAPVKSSSSAPKGSNVPPKDLDSVLNSALDAIGL